VLVALTRTSGAAPAVNTNAVALPLASTHIHNLFRATTNVYSGNAPEGDAAFAEIAKLGIRTVISVDGSKPDLETARKHGLRYIHLPIGYDAIPTNRVVELIKAAQTSDRPIYVHCHHGLHRGPAAVAIICEGTAGWTTNQAVEWLKQAGTAADYAGLYQSAIQFRQPDAKSLASVGKLPEVSTTSALVDAMVAIDLEFDKLKAAQKSGWSRIPDHPDLTPAHTATILWEQFRELARTSDTAQRPEDFRSKLTASEKAADQLRHLLSDPASGNDSRDAGLQAVTRTCASCHKQFRN
jgi:protein tyrosine phosphatase (PTP) superfamily phosphohydrolase (DUF442 family)